MTIRERDRHVSRAYACVCVPSSTGCRFNSTTTGYTRAVNTRVLLYVRRTNGMRMAWSILHVLVNVCSGQQLQGVARDGRVRAYFRPIKSGRTPPPRRDGTVRDFPTAYADRAHLYAIDLVSPIAHPRHHSDKPRRPLRYLERPAAPRPNKYLTLWLFVTRESLSPLSGSSSRSQLAASSTLHKSSVQRPFAGRSTNSVKLCVRVLLVYVCIGIFFWPFEHARGMQTNDNNIILRKQSRNKNSRIMYMQTYKRESL